MKMQKFTIVCKKGGAIVAIFTMVAVIAVVTLGVDPMGLNAAPSECDRDSTRTQEEGRVVKSDKEWKKELSEEAYHVTRQCGTERAFTGEYWDTKTEGTYHCVCCGQALFLSDTKYNSGSGWPSFWEPTDSSHVDEIQDRTHGMARTEVRCSRCDAHLGHVFPDGPQPTGQRYCINSAALKLEPEDEE